MAWQPGLARRLVVRMASFWAADSSEKPYVQAGVGAVRGGGVDDPHVGVVDQGDRFHRSGVRQAQEHQVSGVEQLFPFRRILPLGMGRWTAG